MDCCTRVSTIDAEFAQFRTQLWLERLNLMLTNQSQSYIAQTAVQIAFTLFLPVCQPLPIEKLWLSGEYNGHSPLQLLFIPCNQRLT